MIGRLSGAFISTLVTALPGFAQQDEAYQVKCPSLHIGGIYNQDLIDDYWREGDTKSFVITEEDRSSIEFSRSIGYQSHSFPDKIISFSKKYSANISYLLIVATTNGKIGGYHCGMIISP